MSRSPPTTVIVELEHEEEDQDNDSIDVHLFSEDIDIPEQQINKKRIEPIHPNKNKNKYHKQEKEVEQEQEQEGQGVERGKPTSHDRWLVWYNYLRYLYLIGLFLGFLVLAGIVIWVVYIVTHQDSLCIPPSPPPSSSSST